MQKLFRVRQCEDSYFENRSRPCLQYQIQRCTAPCVNLVTKAEYAAQVHLAKLFLSGDSHRVIEELAAQMETAAGKLEFERAAELRDRIATLKRVQAKQFIEGERGNVDVIGCAYDGGAACLQVAFIRAGRNLGSRSYFPARPQERRRIGHTRRVFESTLFTASTSRRYFDQPRHSRPRRHRRAAIGVVGAQGADRVSTPWRAGALARNGHHQRAARLWRTTTPVTLECAGVWKP